MQKIIINFMAGYPVMVRGEEIDLDVLRQKYREFCQGQETPFDKYLPPSFVSFLESLQGDGYTFEVPDRTDMVFFP